MKYKIVNFAEETLTVCNSYEEAKKIAFKLGLNDWNIRKAEKSKEKGILQLNREIQELAKQLEEQATENVDEALRNVDCMGLAKAHDIDKTLIF